VPIETGPGFDETRSFAEEIGRRLAEAHADILTVEQRLKSRGDRVYLDPLRNAFGATVVAPYSVRRREKAPVSMPLRWQDVKTSLNPSHFNLGNAAKHIAGVDPWHDFFDRRQSLGKAMKALQRA
jgi:bifunctional non-homologous end joining protein LigD